MSALKTTHVQVSYHLHQHLHPSTSILLQPLQKVFVCWGAAMVSGPPEQHIHWALVYMYLISVDVFRKVIGHFSQGFTDFFA